VHVVTIFLCYSYPVYVWYDGINQRLREDVYDGLDSMIMTAVSCAWCKTRSQTASYTHPNMQLTICSQWQDSLYTIYPRINKTVCDAEGAGAGPTLLRGGSVPAVSTRSLMLYPEYSRKYPQLDVVPRVKDHLMWVCMISVMGMLYVMGTS
jgi:hypothetical protein